MPSTLPMPAQLTIIEACLREVERARDVQPRGTAIRQRLNGVLQGLSVVESWLHDGCHCGNAWLECPLHTMAGESRP